jgi:hypothetical protein
MTVTDFSKFIDRAETAPEPVKRSVKRDTTPSPALPLLNRSWDNRADGAKVGESIRIRTYSGDETQTLYRQLRRAADQHETLGVRIEAPSDEYQENGKTKTKFKPGYLKFAAHPKQKRTRKNGDATAAPESPEQEDGQETESEESGQEDGQEQEQESGAWQ